MTQTASPDRIFSYNRAIIALIGVLLISLILINYVVLKQQRQNLMQEVREQAAVELAQAATFMTEPMLRMRLADIEQFIQQWGANNQEIVRFEAITPLGHSLTAFQRPTISEHLFVLEKRVEFADTHLLTLKLEKDYQQTETILVQLRNQLLLASLSVSITLGIILWLLFRFLAIKPLEQEIYRRHRAEEELAEINRSLEERVRKRTREIKELLDLEIYLREIMQTVSDINGLLLTAPNLKTLLTQACDRFIQRKNYKFCWLGLLEQGAIQTVYHASQAPVAPGPGAATPPSAPATGLDTPPYSIDDPRSPFHHHPAARSLRDHQSVIETSELYPHSSPPWHQPSAIDGFQQMITLPLSQPGGTKQPLGVLAVYTWRPEGFEPEEITMLEELAGDLGFAIYSFRHREELNRLNAERTANYEETILTFVNMIEQRDTYTAGHTQRVAEYSLKIGRQMGLPKEEIKRLTKSAILHDIGKIATPDAVLMKPGRFTPLEHDLIRLHTVAGHEMLAGIDMYANLAEIVLYHHERHDGSGYPDRLAGDDIPLLARILAVADAFDAITTNRVYQSKSDVPTALKKLQAMSGKQFHPEVVEAAVKALAGATPPDRAAREIGEERFCTDHRALCRFSQTPLSDLERERFAYFFNDQLTGLHNENFLKSALQSNQYQSLYLCHLQGLARLNKQQGWEKGNSILRLFATELQTRFPEALLFRVYGNDFAVMNEEYQQISQEEFAAFNSLVDTGISPIVRHVDLTKEQSFTLDKLDQVELSAS
ncbi:HD domain-containing phosphohydrolase [Desulfurivibrio alkaliphilus]|uniref:Metal dependent phosphohydrolase n=1 Tax=Desulfurivibrio alkaliphilus (strain DSM 19089 / UNIQEM U267 / AHT2) TaxID=589865 RepID=D6Z066_DESAT|nr:HD domain-containing phosphohydrolase [Desulfurivibrio alkaliphilus]ADH87099.1 metal dependent phosphohydrolase [Desulfurivibrio alkaliphilus AHT 2]